VTLSVIDVAGARVRRLLAGDWRVSGRHEIEWDGRDDRGLQVSAGVYFIRLEAGDEVRAVKVVMTQ
jgi:flagellar hook assembly protein FlgD